MNATPKTNVTINGSKYYHLNRVISHNEEGAAIYKNFYGKSKKEATSKYLECIKKMEQGLAAGHEKITFGAAFKEWFEHVHRSAVKQSSFLSQEPHYRLRIAGSPLSAMKLASIRAINIQSFYNSLIDKGDKPNTIASLNALVSGFFSYCIKTDMLVKNPLGAVALPKDEAAEGKMVVFSHNDICKLVDNAEKHLCDFVFVFGLYTGLRKGELLSLTCEDIDLELCEVHVNTTLALVKIDGKYSHSVTSTKTTSSFRIVPIIEELKPLLCRYINFLKEKSLALGIAHSKGTILFSNKEGGYMAGSALYHQFKSLQRRLDIDPRSVHTLRHTFCTLLARNRTPLKTAMELMGHSKISTTGKYYTHVDMEDKKKGISNLSASFPSRQ
ncbi:MAG: site-specific integrase [Clostridiales bacterium]|nr:site-specific integrase [Clostridiales bacterium]